MVLSCEYVCESLSVSVFVSPVIDSRPVQGEPICHPKTAGIDSSHLRSWTGWAGENECMNERQARAAEHCALDDVTAKWECEGEADGFMPRYGPIIILIIKTSLVLSGTKISFKIRYQPFCGLNRHWIFYFVHVTDLTLVSFTVINDRE